MNQKTKTASAFLAGLVVAALLFLVVPATGLQGTLRTSTAPDLESVDFNQKGGRCSLTNCDLLQEILEALGKTNTGVDTMTGFTNTFTVFTQDFHVLTEVLLEEFGLIEKFEEAKKERMEEIAEMQEKESRRR